MESPPIGQKVRRSGGKMADGQLGYIVEMDNGEPGVKLDRSAEHLVVPYHPSEWRVESRTQFQPMQIARIAYDADRALRMSLGEYGVTEWPGLREQDRITWMQSGPPAKADENRKRLYAAIIGALKG